MAARFKPLDRTGLRRSRVETIQIDRLVRGVDRKAIAGQGLVPVRHRTGFRTVLGCDHLDDGEIEGTSELEVALVMPGHRHDGAGAVAHEDVVRGPDRHRGAGRRIHGMHSDEDTGLLLHLRHAIDVGSVSSDLHVGRHLIGRTGIDRLPDQRMLGGDDHVRGTEDRVRTCREDLQLVITDRKPNTCALGSSDPLALHDPGRLRPVDEVEILEQAIRILGDPEHPLAKRLSKNGMPPTFAAPVDDLLVREDGAQLRTPVDDLLAQEGQSPGVDVRTAFDGIHPGVVQWLPVLGLGGDRAVLEPVDQFSDWTGLAQFPIEVRFIRLQPDPLRPAIVGLVDRRELTRPVVAEAETLELATEIVDRLRGGLPGMNAGLHRILFGRKTERIESHRVKDVVPGHAPEPGEDVRGDVPLGVPDMEARPGGIGKHVEAVELGLRRVEVGITRPGTTIGVVGFPPGLPPLLHGIGQGGVVPVGGASIVSGGVRLFRHHAFPRQELIAATRTGAPA